MAGHVGGFSRRQLDLVVQRRVNRLHPGGQTVVGEIQPTEDAVDVEEAAGADEGRFLAAFAGQAVSLEIRAQRIPATGCNVIAHKGARQDGRIVVFAHIDARMGTPGAGDNASGTIVLLLLAELLADYIGEMGIELVAMNGEDYFSNPGEKQLSLIHI